jgi:hypothetical protein
MEKWEEEEKLRVQRKESCMRWHGARHQSVFSYASPSATALRSAAIIRVHSPAVSVDKEVMLNLEPDVLGVTLLQFTWTVN